MNTCKKKFCDLKERKVFLCVPTIDYCGKPNTEFDECINVTKKE